MLGFVVVGKDHFPFLFLKLGFACDNKETNSILFLTGCLVAAFEPDGDCVRVSLLCEALVLGFLLILLFRSASITIWCCLAKDSANAFNPLVISLRACLFDLSCFDFGFFSGAS